MRTILLSVFFYALCSVFCFGQNVQNSKVEGTSFRKCGTYEVYQKQMATDSGYKFRREQVEAFVDSYVKEHPDYDDKTVITIPVVVHIIYNGSSQNISNTRVTDQIAASNKDYAGTNTHSMQAFSTTLKANTNIQFCLAKVDPSGHTTTGITRTSTTVSDFSSLDYSERHTSQGGCDAWDVTKYFNIWVCNLGSSMCGYSEFPSSPLDGNYGSAINYLYFGTTGSSAPYNLGGTLTHEVGHCLNLYHTWGDDGGACSGTDYCNDTPNQADATYGTNSGVVTDACTTTSPGIMYMDFMDYSDDINYANFTPNQVSRMQALFATGGALVSLKSSTVCSGNGIEEATEINNIDIYPSPSNGLINVMFELSNHDNVTISVTNMIGQVVATVEKENVTKVNVPIDLSGQSSGIYLVKIQSGNQTLTQKVSLIK